MPHCLYYPRWPADRPSVASKVVTQSMIERSDDILVEGFQPPMAVRKLLEHDKQSLALSEEYSWLQTLPDPSFYHWGISGFDKHNTF